MREIAELAGFVGLFIVPVIITGGISWSVLKTLDKEEIEPGLIEEILSSITLGLGGIGAIVLFLAECGTFNVTSYLASVVAVNTAFWAFLGTRKKFRKGVNFRVWLVCGAFMLLLILIARLVLPPFEQVYGGRDGGVYIHQAFWFAHSGGFDFGVPSIVKVLSDKARDYFLFEFFKYEPAGLRFLYLYSGFYWVESRNVLGFQFLHLYPSILASGMLVSIKQSLILTPLLGLMGVVWLFILGKSIFGRNAGFLAAFLWTINPLFIWFSRYANAEVLMLVFILAGIWGLAEAAAGKGASLKVFAFICLGLGSLTKIEALLVVVPLAIISLMIPWKKRELVASLVPFAVLYCWSGLHALTFSKHYVQMTLAGVMRQMMKFSPVNLAVYSSIAAGAILFLILLLKRGIRILPLIKVVSLVWTTAGLIGYMLPASVGISGGFVPWGWFMSPALVLLASIGPLVIVDDLKTKNEAGKAWVLLVFAGFLIIMNARFAMYGDYPWGARRTVSGAMPLFTLIGSYPLFRGVEHGTGFLKKGFIILLVVIIASCLPLDIKFLKHSEYGEAIETVENFAAVFPKNSIIIFEGSLPGSWLSLPLAFQKGQVSLVFWLDQESMPTIDLESVQEVVHKAEAFNMPVYLVTTKDYNPPALDCEFRPVKTFDLEVPTFEFLNYNSPPLNKKIWQFTLYIYRLSVTSHIDQ